MYDEPPRLDSLPPVTQITTRYDGTMSISVKRSYDLKLEHVEFLKKFNGQDWLELRNYRYDDPTEERDSRIGYELVAMEVLETDGMSWHLTFRLTDVGKQVVSQLP
jgi:hypothetical protein